MDVDIMGLSPPGGSPQVSPRAAPLKAMKPPKEKKVNSPRATPAVPSQTKASKKSVSFATESSPTSTPPAAHKLPSQPPPTQPPSHVIERVVLKGHTAAVVGCSWNPKVGEMIATCSTDSTARIWTLQPGSTKFSSSALHHGPKVKLGAAPPTQVTKVVWSPTGNGMATGTFEGAVRFWDAGPSAKTQLNTKLSCHSGSVFCLKWNHSGSVLASAGHDGSICLFKLRDVSPNGAELFHKISSVHEKPILDIDWNSNDWLVSCSADGTIRVIPEQSLMASSTSDDLSENSEPGTIATLSCDLHTSAVNSVSWKRSKNEYIFASASDDTTVAIWDLTPHFEELVKSSIAFNDVMQQRQGKGLTKLTSNLAENNEEKMDVDIENESSQQGNTGAYEPKLKCNSTVNVVIATKTPQMILEGHGREVYLVRWNPAQTNQLASASFDGVVKIWNQTSGKCLWTFADHALNVTSLEFSPDGKFIASGASDQLIHIYDTSNGTLVKRFKCQGIVLDISWNGLGNRIAACCSDNSAVVFDCNL